MRIAPRVEISDEERATLTRWSRGRKTPTRLVLRAKMVLLAAEGKRNDEIAEAVSAGRDTVGLWRGRFLKLRLAGIEKDLPRVGSRLGG